jgi:ribosomal protein S18 acetylase RimI-like enzyme
MLIVRKNCNELCDNGGIMEIIVKEDKEIVYEMFQEKDLEETAKLLSETFTRGGTTTRSLKITPEEYYPLAYIYSKKAIKEGLSMIAKDKNNGKIVSFMINEDFDSPKPEGIEKIGPKVAIGMTFIDVLEEDLRANKKEGERRFHMFLGGTDKDYENKHILSSLLDESMKLAKNKNFTSIIAEPSCFATQHIFKNLGFTQKNFIEYKKFKFQGKNVFENIEGPVGIPLMEKRL